MPDITRTLVKDLSSKEVQACCSLTMRQEGMMSKTLRMLRQEIKFVDQDLREEDILLRSRYHSVRYRYLGHNITKQALLEESWVVRAYEDGVLAGWALLMPVRSQDKESYWYARPFDDSPQTQFYVRKAYRQKGLGRLLFQECEAITESKIIYEPWDFASYKFFGKMNPERTEKIRGF